MTNELRNGSFKAASWRHALRPHAEGPSPRRGPHFGPLSGPRPPRIEHGPGGLSVVIRCRLCLLPFSVAWTNGSAKRVVDCPHCRARCSIVSAA